MRFFKQPISRKFVNASAQYLRHGDAAAAVTPFTMACWFNSAAANLLRTLMAFGNSSAANSFHLFSVNASAQIQASSRTAAGTASATSIATYASNRWHHAAGTWASATSRIAWCDGQPGAENTTSRAPTPNSTLVGVNEDNGVIGTSACFNGFIAWPAIWNIALTQPEIERLARGAHPCTVRPESLVAFWEWTGADLEFGLRGTFPLVNTGTMPVSGPAFLATPITRRRRHVGTVAAAAGNRRRRVIICGARA